MEVCTREKPDVRQTSSAKIGNVKRYRRLALQIQLPPERCMLRLSKNVNAKKNEARSPKSKPFFMILRVPRGCVRLFGVCSFITQIAFWRKKNETRRSQERHTTTESMVSLQQLCVVDAKLHVFYAEFRFIVFLFFVDRGDSGEHVCGACDRNSGDGD